jgi:hypothetical protein
MVELEREWIEVVCVVVDLTSADVAWVAFGAESGAEAFGFGVVLAWCGHAEFLGLALWLASATHELEQSW